MGERSCIIFTQAEAPGTAGMKCFASDDRRWYFDRVCHQCAGTECKKGLTTFLGLILNTQKEFYG
jgi:hypothetical protein